MFIKQTHWVTSAKILISWSKLAVFEVFNSVLFLVFLFVFLSRLFDFVLTSIEMFRHLQHGTYLFIFIVYSPNQNLISCLILGQVTQQEWTAGNEVTAKFTGQLEPYLATFQDPAKSDATSRLQSDLDETKIILVRYFIRASISTFRIY